MPDPWRLGRPDDAAARRRCAEAAVPVRGPAQPRPAGQDRARGAARSRRVPAPPATVRIGARARSARRTPAAHRPSESAESGSGGRDDPDREPGRPPRLLRVPQGPPPSPVPVLVGARPPYGRFIEAGFRSSPPCLAPDPRGCQPGFASPTLGPATSPVVCSASRRVCRLTIIAMTAGAWLRRRINQDEVPRRPDPGRPRKARPRP